MTLQQIREHVLEAGLSNDLAKFACYDCGLFTYAHKKKGSYHEFSFHCEDTLLSKMSISELCTLKKITYFSYRVFELVDGKHGDVTFSMDFVLNNNLN